MQNYRNLNVWEKSYNFTKKIYLITEKFPKNELYGLTSQIRRASISISLNIAEGCGLDTDKSFSRFLRIALGSAFEVDNCLLFAKDFKYINEEEYKDLYQDLNEIRKMLYSLIKKL